MRARGGRFRSGIANLAVVSLSQNLQIFEDRSEGGSHEDVTPVQLVRQHQLEVFAESFPGWVASFAVLYCLAAPVAFGLFVWLAVSFGRELDRSCDVPLKVWAIVVFASTVYDVLHTLLIHYVCSFDPSRQGTLPWYVRLYAAMFSLLDFGWLGVGLHWVRTSRSCEATSPLLFESAKVYAAVSMVLGIIVGVNAVGLYTILCWMLRNGMLSTSMGAPPETINRQQILSFDASRKEFQDSPDCCVCLAAFDICSEEIRLTHCGHVFHGKCLGNWLRVNRTCPLCRRDLTQGFAVDEKGPVSFMCQHIVGRAASA